MQHQLMKLPYPEDALEPHISAQTLQYHYGKHHATYVAKLNGLIQGTKYEDKPLDTIIKKAEGAIFNNAAQVFNHDFYWFCLTPNPTEPSVELVEKIERTFGSFAAFKETFSATAASLFGSGWAWLTVDDKGELKIGSYANADTPIRHNLVPLLTCDVWEHAYYLDYQNARPAYLENFWKLVNWNFVSENLGRYQERKSFYYIHECNEPSLVCDYMQFLEDAERTAT